MKIINKIGNRETTPIDYRLASENKLNTLLCDFTGRLVPNFFKAMPGSVKLYFNSNCNSSYTLFFSLLTIVFESTCSLKLVIYFFDDENRGIYFSGTWTEFYSILSKYDSFMNLKITIEKE